MSAKDLSFYENKLWHRPAYLGGLQWNPGLPQAYYASTTAQYHRIASAEPKI